MRYGVLVGELVRTVSRFAIIGVIGGMAAACSSDAMRFSQAPFSNPFSTSTEPDPRETGSVDGRAPSAVAPMPRGQVQSAPLAAPGPRTASNAPVYNRPAPASTAPVRTAASGRAVPGWRSEGGTPVTVGQGDTIETISGRYGVPAGAILSTNGIAAAQVTPGRRLVIPVYTIVRSAPASAPAPVHVAAAPAPAAQGRVVARTKLADAAPGSQALQPRTLGAQAHARPGRSEAPAATRMAQAEPRMTGSVEPKAHPRPGRQASSQVANQPAGKTAEAKPPAKAEKAPAIGRIVKSEPLPVVREKPAKVALAAPAPAKVAKADPAPEPAKAQMRPAQIHPAKVAAVEVAKPEPVKVPAKEVESTGALPAQPASAGAEFRWPARGRVISGFGGGGSNEGINIAVPDGTPVKAAESGTVAYAGSEVKGYGNLVLIRHDNGYVSAYAHNGDVEVKRGQRVTRGQMIAKSGQSGNVTSPQLHFEIRKGSTPVDPMPYLASN